MITNTPKAANARGLIRKAARTLRRGAVLAMAMALALVAPSAAASKAQSEPRTETAPPTGAKPRTARTHRHHTQEPGRPSGYAQEPPPTHKPPPTHTDPNSSPPSPGVTEPSRNPEAPPPGVTAPPPPTNIAPPPGAKRRPAPKYTEQKYPEFVQKAEHGELPEHGEGPEQVRFAPAQKPRSLPFTGMDLRWEISVGVLLIAAGCLIAIVRRFRSNG